MATLLRTVFASMFLLFVLVGTKFLFEDRLSPTDSGIQGELRQPHVDVLFIGSSHTRQGYDARSLEEATGKHAFVVAYDGLDPVAMLPVVRTLLADPAKRPQLLIIEANCVRLAREPDVEDTRLFFEAPPRVKRDLITDYLRTHHGREAYLDLMTLVANRGNDLILTWPLVHGIIDGLSYHGGYVGKNMSGLSPRDFTGLRVQVAGDHPNPDQLAALQSIIELAKADHVAPLLVDTPMPAPIELQPDIRALQQRFHDLAVVSQIPYYRGDDGFPTDNPGFFHDSSHLSTAGRELYTQIFARQLKAHAL